MADIVAGRVALAPKGEWESSVQYQKLDIVSFNNGSYICRKDNIGKEPIGGHNEYWQLMTQSSDESKPRIDVEIGFWENGKLNKNNLKIHNWEYYVENGYMLAILKKGRYKIADEDAAIRNGEEESSYHKINYYGWKMTVTNAYGEPFPDDTITETNWVMNFCNPDVNGVVCFDETGERVESDNIVHKKYYEDSESYGIASPRGKMSNGDSAVQVYGVAFVDTTKYRQWCDAIKDKDCVSNIASFRIFVNKKTGKSYFRK